MRRSHDVLTFLSTYSETEPRIFHFRKSRKKVSIWKREKNVLIQEQRLEGVALGKVGRSTLFRKSGKYVLIHQRQSQEGVTLGKVERRWCLFRKSDKNVLIQEEAA